MGMHWESQAFGLIACLMAYAGSSKGSARWQIALFVVTAVILGYSLSPNGPYWLAASLFLFSVLSVARYAFYEQMGHTELLWLEPILYCCALASYIGGNILHPIGWAGWVFPLPILGTSAFKLIGLVVDMNFFTNGLKGRNGAEVGQFAPAFTLTDQDGNTVSLADYKGQRHVLVIFVRGDWCPTCHIMLRTYERYKEKLLAKNIVILTIGPDPVGVNRDMVIRLGLDYKILADDRNEAAKAYGMLFQKNAPMTKYVEGIPLPAAFLVDINGVIVFTSDPRKPGQILKPDSIFPVVEKLQAI